MASLMGMAEGEMQGEEQRVYVQRRKLSGAALEAERMARRAARKGEKDRHVSRQGKTKRKASNSKKSGAGARTVWGRATDIYDYEPALDRGDPNYNSEEDDDYDTYLVGSGVEGTHGYGERTFSGTAAEPEPTEGSTMNLSRFKELEIALLREYFVCGDKEEVARTLREARCPSYHFEFVKRCITMAMDGNAKDREAASQLLSFLHGEGIVKREHFTHGARKLLHILGDLAVDVPNADRLLAQFLARLVVDEILPPIYLVESSAEGLGESALAQARTILSINHSSARTLGIWGPGAAPDVEKLKKHVRLILAEYKDSHDIEEASKCVQKLEANYYHHELVKRAIVMTMDGPEETRRRTLQLLEHLAKKGQISQTQMVMGFERVRESLNDLRLDTPNAADVFAYFVANAVSSKTLPESYVRLLAK